MITRFWHESGNQFTKSEVRQLVEQYGSDILIGGDPGWDEFKSAMAAVDEYEAFKHVYLVGPGMMDWSPEEAAQVKAHAKSVGVDTKKKNWHDEWLDWGWLEKQKSEFKNYDELGFFSAEIDNLDQIWDQDPDEYLKFCREFFRWMGSEGLNIKLMVKNLSREQLLKLINSDIDRERFCPFGMFEKGSGSPQEQIRLAAKLGIKAVTPINGLRPTENYGTTRKGIPFE